MTLVTALTIVCALLTAVCGIGYLYFRDNVKLTYKEQRIPEVRK